jgi:hypothetical protein
MEIIPTVRREEECDKLCLGDKDLAKSFYWKQKVEKV